MSITAYWSPNQAAIAQVETYTFSAPVGVGNTYTATINGKSVTYSSIAADTAALATTGLFNLLNLSTGVAPELTEITFANPSAGVLTATASVPGTPFANVPGTSAGLVMGTGNGLTNGIATVHTTANQSPSDVNDAQNWVRANLGVTPPSKTRALPQNGDDVVLANSAVPMLWNLDQLILVQFNSFKRNQSMTGQIGLPELNANGYAEWRAKHFRFVGPQGSVPAGGLTMVLGYADTTAGGPSLERYNNGSQQVTLNVLVAGQVDWLGVHTLNTFTVMGGALLNVGMNPGEVATLSSSTVDGGSSLGIGPNVTWTAASTLTVNGGSAILNAAPATLTMVNGAQVTITTDSLTWAAITAQGGSTLTMLAGGTITNSTIDGDTCQFIDPLNAITWTNATSVKQQVTSGPFQVTGTRTFKVT